jgi:dipeptidase E
MDENLGQIIALGGGGFSMEPENPALDQYILAQCEKSLPAVCFLPTATGDSDRYIVTFYDAFLQMNCRPTHLSFFRRTVDLRSYILKQDVIYVGGGNTKSMLAVWQEWGLPELLKEAWENGTVLAGISAGAICWFEHGISDSFADRLVAVECLGFLGGSCCPHYDGEADRRPFFQESIRKKAIKPGYGVDDGAALHFIGNDLKRVVASRENARAYYVEARNGEVIEEALPVHFMD